MSACGTESSRRREAIRLPSWSSLEGSRRGSSPAASESPSWCRYRAGSRRASYGASRSCRRDPAAAPRGGRRARRRARPDVACGHAARDFEHRDRACRALRADRRRCAGSLPPSTRRSTVYRSASDPERRTAHRALAFVTDAEARSGSPRLAPRAGHRGPTRMWRVSSSTRRDGRRPAAGSLPPRHSWGVRPSSPPTRPAAPSACWPPPTSTCRLAPSTPRSGCSAVAEAGPLDEVGQAHLDLLKAEVAFAQNRGSDAPQLLLEAAKKFEALDPRLARETYLDAWSAALFAGGLANAGEPPRRLPRGARPHPSRNHPVPPTCCWMDSRWCSRRDARAATPVLQRAAEAFAGTRPRWRRCSAGAGWRRRPPSICGTTTPASPSPRARSQLARESGALEVLADRRSTCSARPPPRRGLRDDHDAGHRGRGGHALDQHPRRSVWRARAGGPSAVTRPRPPS